MCPAPRALARRAKLPTVRKSSGKLATAVGTIRHHGVETPPPDTVEGLLYALPQDQFIVSPPQLAGIVGDAKLATRVSPWFGYAPLDPAHLAGLDGLVFVKDSTRSAGADVKGDRPPGAGAA